jgi:hypothetical protein
VGGGSTISDCVHGNERNGAAGEDVRMSRHGAEMARPTCKSIGKSRLGARQISEYNRMTQRRASALEE